MYRSMRTFKKAWVKALRSGEYEQGTNMLCRPGVKSEEPDYFCCLGVAANLLIEAGHDLEWQPNPNDTHSLNLVAGKDTHPGKLTPFGNKLPTWLKDWLTMGRRESRLIEMNDGGVSFKGVANKIESWQ